MTYSSMSSFSGKECYKFLNTNDFLCLPKVHFPNKIFKNYKPNLVPPHPLKKSMDNYLTIPSCNTSPCVTKKIFCKCITTLQRFFICPNPTGWDRSGLCLSVHPSVCLSVCFSRDANYESK